MIATIGIISLWIAALLALLQTVLGGLALTDGRKHLSNRIAAITIAQAGFVTLAFACLLTVFALSDFTVKLVVANSHSAKPMIYKISGTWGNHEGSMLLWVTILAAAGATIARFEHKLRSDTKIATLAAQGAIALGFYGFLLIASDPFERIAGKVEGLGLNPLLQDPGLAFHPPTLYAGYVGMSAAFSFAVGALITRDVGQDFARAMRPWILGAWIFLTIGITAGSYWAYYELGWGGWWFWDPVENASLMPWLAATALLHSVTVLATRNGLRAWTIMLAVVAFSMSMMGTFLVRSGILTSVHSFAVDPERGIFLLGLLCFYIGGALTLFGLRISTVTEGSRFAMVSREGALIVNNLLLSVILVIVMAGTLYPLALEAWNGTKISVGAPYYNEVAGPLALVLMVFMAVGPLMRWRSDDGGAVFRRLAAPFAAAIITLALLVIFAPPMNTLNLSGLVIAAGVAAASVAPLWKRNLRRTPLFTWGMVFAHLGCAVCLAGMASDSAFTKENLIAMSIGETQKIGPFSVTLHGAREISGPNYAALEAILTAKRGTTAPTVVAPQLRLFSNPEMITNEASIHTYWNGQLYVVLGQLPTNDKLLMRLWWKPFVTLIWLGGALIALGGLLSLIGRLRREARI